MRHSSCCGASRTSLSLQGCPFGRSLGSLLGWSLLLGGGGGFFGSGSSLLDKGLLCGSSEFLRRSLHASQVDRYTALWVF